MSNANEETAADETKRLEIVEIATATPGGCAIFTLRFIVEWSSPLYHEKFASDMLWEIANAGIKGFPGLTPLPSHLTRPAPLSGKAAADARVAELEAALKLTLAGFEWHYTIGGSRHDDSSRRIIAEARKALSPTPPRQI